VKKQRIDTRLFFFIVLAVVLMVTPNLWGTEDSLRSKASDDLDAVLEWLAEQQDTMTGLLPSQQDRNASTYNNALAVMAFVHHNQTKRAKHILDYFQSRFNNTEFFVGGEPRGFFQYRDSTNGEPFCSNPRWMGDNAWLAMAIHYYKKATGDSTYDNMAKAIVALVSSLQQPDGYIASGWERSSNCTGEFLNTTGIAEGNLDAYKALSLYGESNKAAAVKLWLDYKDLGWKDTYLDLHSWRVLSLGRSYGFCLLDTKPFQRTIKYKGKSVTGYLPFIDKIKPIAPNIWSEGTGQMAVAFYRAGYKDRGDFLVKQMRKLVFEPKDYPGTLTVSYFALAERKWHKWANPSKGHVAGVCWYIFAEDKFDPFNGGRIQPSEPRNPVCRIEAENYIANSGGGVREDYRGMLSEGKGTHIAGDNDLTGDESGWTYYQFNLLLPMENGYVRVRYADDVGGDTCTILIDGKEIGSFNSIDTGTWDDFTWSEPIAIGSLSQGVHTLALEGVDKGTYGVTVDYIKIER
jgi:cellulose synthase operon protein B